MVDKNTLEQFKKILPQEVFDKFKAEESTQRSAWEESMLLGTSLLEIAKDLFKPGGLRRFAYFIRHYIRLPFMPNRFYALTVGKPVRGLGAKQSKQGR